MHPFTRDSAFRLTLPTRPMELSHRTDMESVQVHKSQKTVLLARRPHSCHVLSSTFEHISRFSLCPQSPYKGCMLNFQTATFPSPTHPYSLSTAILSQATATPYSPSIPYHTCSPQDGLQTLSEVYARRVADRHTRTDLHSQRRAQEDARRPVWDQPMWHREQSELDLPERLQ